MTPSLIENCCRIFVCHRCAKRNWTGSEAFSRIPFLDIINDQTYTYSLKFHWFMQTRGQQKQLVTSHCRLDWRPIKRHLSCKRHGNQHEGVNGTVCALKRSTQALISPRNDPSGIQLSLTFLSTANENKVKLYVNQRKLSYHCRLIIQVVKHDPHPFHPISTPNFRWRFQKLGQLRW